jgi:hypothetical protein
MADLDLARDAKDGVAEHRRRAIRERGRTLGWEALVDAGEREPAWVA